MTMIEDERNDAPNEVLDEFKRQLPDADPAETQEWIEALDGVVADPRPRARRLPAAQGARSAPASSGSGCRGSIQTALHQHHLPEQEPPFPGDEEMELRVRRIIRWNAAAHGAARRTSASPGSAGTCPPTPRPRASTRWASTTSSAARTTAARATRSTSRATPRPASTRARSSRAGSRRRSSITSGARWCAARGSPPIRTRG